MFVKFCNRVFDERLRFYTLPRFQALVFPGFAVSASWIKDFSLDDFRAALSVRKLFDTGREDEEVTESSAF